MFLTADAGAGQTGVLAVDRAGRRLPPEPEPDLSGEVRKAEAWIGRRTGGRSSAPERRADVQHGHPPIDHKVVIRVLTRIEVDQNGAWVGGHGIVAEGIAHRRIERRVAGNQILVVEDDNPLSLFARTTVAGEWASFVQIDRPGA